MAEISLGIPVFNSSLFLEDLFECLRTLDPLPDEIIMLDDASSDDSLRRLRMFHEKSALRVTMRILANARNMGIAGAYNCLAREARCDWLQVLDGDDVLVERDYFAQLKPALSADNDLVVTGLESNSGLLANGSRLFRALVPYHPPVWWPLLGSFATRSGVIYRRRFLAEHPFHDPMYPGSDVIHLLDLRRNGRCVYMPRPRVFHRVHERSQSSRSKDYAAYRRQLASYGGIARVTYGLDIALRQMGRRWSR
jgi:glycosyltransferase involved in cell wall biosynthesis